MADVIAVLKKIETLEGRISELYKWLGSLFSGDQEISSFFNRLSAEEQQHRNIALYQLRVVRKSPLMFDQIEVAPSFIDEAMANLKHLRDNPTPTIKEALELSLELENCLCEEYYSSVMKQSNPEFAAVIDSLASACKDHHRGFLEMASKYKITQES